MTNPTLPPNWLLTLWLVTLLTVVGTETYRYMNKNNEAGKGDKLRRGISQDEWEKKWKKIFGKKEKSVRPHKSDNENSES